MARIDRFIQAALKAGARKISFASGETVQAILPSGPKPMTPQPATLKQVQSLLAEILPPGEAPGPGGRSVFSHASPAGPVTVTATAGPNVVRIEIVAAGVAIADAATAIPVAASDPAAAGSVVGLDGTGAEEAVLPVSSAPVAGQVLPARPSEATTLEMMETLLRRLVEQGCSDLHLSTGNPPLFRKDGEIVRLGEEEAFSADQARDLLLSIASERYRKEFDEKHDVDFAYEISGVARYRCNLFMDRVGMGGVFRIIPSKIPSFDELGLPPVAAEFCGLTKGLVLVTGPTGSGKSTTLAAMVGHINATRNAHVITIEDPIEFVHPNRKCLVNQREVGIHTVGFKAALRAALREDPDIVLVGEMRDLETIAIAIETAETGHLVFGTLHTNTAASTVDRIIDQFPADRQAQVRTMMADSLKGVISQTLCRKIGGGRLAALEILVVNSAISNLIREGKTFQIPSLMQTGRGIGMRTMNDALLELLTKKLVEPAEAYAKAINKEEFRGMLERGGFRLKKARQPAKPKPEPEPEPELAGAAT